MTDEARRAELAALIETGWTNTPFSRCSFCGKDWDGGTGHDHGQGEMDPEPPYGLILVHEDKGGTIKFDAGKAADAVLAYVADVVAQAGHAEQELREGVGDYLDPTRAGVTRVAVGILMRPSGFSECVTPTPRPSAASQSPPRTQRCARQGTSRHNMDGPGAASRRTTGRCSAPSAIRWSIQKAIAGSARAASLLHDHDWPGLTDRRDRALERLRTVASGSDGGHAAVRGLDLDQGAAMTEHTEACWAMPTCTVCGLTKKPVGRSAPLEMANSLCDHECPGYAQEPRSGHLWPGEPADD